MYPKYNLLLTKECSGGVALNEVFSSRRAEAEPHPGLARPLLDCRQYQIDLDNFTFNPSILSLFALNWPLASLSSGCHSGQC